MVPLSPGVCTLMLIYTRAMDPEHPLVDGRGMSQAHSDSRERNLRRARRKTVS